MSTSDLILKFESLPNAIRRQLMEQINLLFKRYSSKPKSSSKKKYDFSDLIGKLRWEGNALIVQKKLRDERR